jgi:hypothetical protein
MSIKTKSIYSWFDTKEYAAARNLKPHDWALMLEVRLGIQSDYDNRFKPYLDANVELRAKYWTAYCHQVSPKRFLEQKANGELSPLWDQRWPLFEIPITTLTGNPPITPAIGTSDLRLLIVDPSAGDRDLEGEFKQWLKQMREAFPLPFKTQGPRALNAQLKLSHLNKWVKCNILGLFDLQFCNRVFGQKKDLLPGTAQDNTT